MTNMKPDNQEKSSSNLHSSQILKVLPFATALISVFFLWLVLFLKWKKMGYHPFSFSIIALPPLESVLFNLRSALQGYTTGHSELLTGILIFGVMVLFFMSAGKIILTCILKPSNSCQQINLLERISLYYLPGSLFVSLF